MAKGDFNDYMNPKAETKRFKLYVDVSADGKSDDWELQGRGVESWTYETGSDVEKTPDVLGFVDMERSTPQPTQSGVSLKLRKESKLANIVFNAMYSGDTSKLDAMRILQKFEFADADNDGNCLARVDNEALLAINNLSAEAGGYIGVEVDIHYSNNFILGSMPKSDGVTIEFTPND